jgi:hypothetical protein
MKSIFAQVVLRQAVLCVSLTLGSLPALCAGNITVRTTNYPTLGNPTSAVETYDGRYVFVSVTNVGGENFSGPDSAAGTRKNVVSGVQIFRRSRNHDGELVPAGFVPLGSTGTNGLALLRGGKTLGCRRGLRRCCVS